jgi:adenosine deaminase
MLSVVPAMRALVCGSLALLVASCGTPGAGDDDQVDAWDVDALDVDGAGPDAAVDGAGDCGTAPQCAAIWEENASDRLEAIVGDPVALTAFLKAVPKGGDLHQHLSGAVYAETYLEWARADGDCINTTTHTAVYSNQCSAATQPTPTPGAFYDEIVRAWSMKDFVPGGAETGRDHFFATFGKFGAVAGAHRYDSIADVLVRAADENQLYVETMFNLGTNVGSLAASVWSGPVTAADLPAFYDQLMADTQFATRLANDVNVVTATQTGYRATLGCAGANPPAACQVGLRFIAQVSRTGSNDQIFGQLVSAFEMASVTPYLVGVNLSSPEDDSRSLNNYELHMAMLGFLHDRYTATGRSPLHVTLHAGEIVPQYLPPGSNHNTFHIKRAVEVARAQRIGHGVDILSETDNEALMTLMRDRGVLVEVCLSSNDQILEVSGAAHPLDEYLARGVPVALATDDQGVSRSSLAGEYERAVLDQEVDYRQLKTMARDSLAHAFLPGTNLWTSVSTATPVTDCATTDMMALGDEPNATCAGFLATSERARMQWELERRFLAFERVQPATP